MAAATADQAAVNPVALVALAYGFAGPLPRQSAVNVTSAP